MPAQPQPVALARCEDYDLARVEAALRRSIDLLGGIGAFVKPGQTVLLKANLLRATAPEKAASTHPAVVAAMAKLVIEAGARAIIADSPGGPYAVAMLRVVYRKTGMTWAAEVSGATLNENVEAVQVAHPQGHLLHRLDIIKVAAEADVIINLAKLKTHNLTTLTLAVKNLFGLVPGVIKVSYHAKLQDPRLFCQGLLDIATYAKPALNIVDAVVAMEGNGPSGGEPRQIGALVVSADFLATDVVCAALVSYDPLIVTTTRLAVERGLTTGRVEDVPLLGDALESLRVQGFRSGTATVVDPGLMPKKLLGLIRLPAAPASAEDDTPGGVAQPRRSLFGRLASGWVWKQIIVTPQAGSKCIACGICVRSCPVGAITLVNKRAYMDANKCIRCYCCHELCPEEAITLERPWLGRLLLGR
jgi:uncharacterized protein (DUF362 family)/Pyruvate/2-oxoacid:ferredoxin oxidoreductase delta subunit